MPTPCIFCGQPSVAEKGIIPFCSEDCRTDYDAEGTYCHACFGPCLGHSVELDYCGGEEIVRTSDLACVECGELRYPCGCGMDIAMERMIQHHIDLGGEG